MKIFFLFMSCIALLMNAALLRAQCPETAPRAAITLLRDSVAQDTAYPPALRMAWLDYASQIPPELLAGLDSFTNTIRELSAKYPRVGDIPQAEVDSFARLYQKVMGGKLTFDAGEQWLLQKAATMGDLIAVALAWPQGIKKTPRGYRQATDSLLTKTFSPENIWENDELLAEVILLRSKEVLWGEIDPLAIDLSLPLAAGNFWLWMAAGSTKGKSYAQLAQAHPEWVERFVNSVRQHVPEMGTISFSGSDVYQGNKKIAAWEGGLPTPCSELPDDPQELFLVLAYLTR